MMAITWMRNGNDIAAFWYDKSIFGNDRMHAKEGKMRNECHWAVRSPFAPKSCNLLWAHNSLALESILFSTHDSLWYQTSQVWLPPAGPTDAFSPWYEEGGVGEHVITMLFSIVPPLPGERSGNAEVCSSLRWMQMFLCGNRLPHGTRTIIAMAEICSKYLRSLQ